MPHLEIQYSKSLEDTHDITGLCETLAKGILAFSYYPKGGLRVRAFAADHIYIADGDPKNAFVDVKFRIGAGRSDAQKAETGQALMTCLEDFFKDIKDDGYLMLSLEISEISKAFSWKTNSVHARLAKE